MTLDASTKKEEIDLDRPFTSMEKLKIILLGIVGYPIGLAILLLPGAWIRTFPYFPSLWYGFIVIEMTIPIVLVVGFSFLLDHHPRLIRTRTNKIIPGKNESLMEQQFHTVATIIYVGGILFTTYDASANTNYPKLWNWIGIVSILLSLAGIFWVFRVNTYAARVVYVQPGQRLITTGPYAIVRHPMYLSMIPGYCGIPLAVGSFLGVIPMVLCSLALIFRTYHEEEFLLETFGKEYQDYQRRVPYRVIPFVY